MGFPEAVRLKIRRRAHFQCCICHSLGVEVHHIQPLSQGGANAEENAAALCPSCHEIYGANATKRKLIREARNLWNEICDARYQTPSNATEEVRQRLGQLASKKDITRLREEVLEAVSSLNGTIRLGRPAVGAKAKYVVKTLSADDLVVMLYARSSRRSARQAQLLLLEPFWKDDEQLFDDFRQFALVFGRRALVKLAIHWLDDLRIPIRPNGLTKKEASDALSVLQVDLTCYMLAHRGEIDAGLDQDGDLIWLPGRKPGWWKRRRTRAAVR